MKVFFLKIADKTMISKLESQFRRNRVFIYNTSVDYDKERVLETFRGAVDGFTDIVILIIDYDKSTNEKVIEKIWLGKCKQVQKHPYKLVIRHEKLLSRADQSFSLFQDCYTVCQKSDLKELIDEKPGYLFVKQFPVGHFYESIYTIPIIQRNYLNPPHKGDILEFLEYEIVENNIVGKKAKENLHPLAQKNYHAIRSCQLSTSSVDRGEFQRDRDRIVHSKAFRRLVDKAQIYTSSKGDHFRTRLTHTLEVNQIARAIARNLGLNEDLTEAIALGHDLGHTPFGHEGERELDLILAGKVKLSEIHSPENYGGFKHNYQGIRIANYLEERYSEHEGLNLTYQVLEGMLKHTKIKKCKLDERKCNGCADRCYDIREFMIVGDTKYLYLEQDYPSTLEGQVVNWADEIAQRGHDLDDGMRSGVLSRDDLLDLGEQLNALTVVSGSADEKLIAEINEIINNVIQSSYPSNGRVYIDPSDLARAQIVSKVISFFITRLTEHSKLKMEVFWRNNTTFDENPVVNEQVVCFEKNDENLLKQVGDVITNKVINSYEVNCFDGKAAYVIRRLFKSFYANPRQLPDNVISRIIRELSLLGCDVVDIRKGKKDVVSREIEIFKGQRSSYRNLDEMKPQKRIWDDICEDYIKRRVFMRCIADHIGGMTDEYANTTFKQLYIP